MLPLVVTVESPNGQTRRYAFADSPVRVGRSPFAELQLTEAFVSRWEGTLRFDENEVTYFHVSQTNPTYIDGRLAGVHEEVAIGETSVLTVGELKLRFKREPVREEDLRRKGKRRPIKADDEAVAKTVWLDAGKPLGPASSAEPPPPSQYPEPERPQPVAYGSSSAFPSAIAPRDEYASGRSEAPPSYPAQSFPAQSFPAQPNPGSVRPEPATPSVRPPASVPPNPGAGGSVHIARGVRVIGAQSIATPAPTGPRSDPPTSPSSRPGVSDQVQSLVRPPGGFGAPAAERHAPPSAEQVGSSSERPVGGPAWEAPRAGSQRPPVNPNDIEALHGEYRAAWRSLIQALARALERAPEGQRSELAEQFQRRYPQVAQEPDFRALLKQYRLEARKPEVAEIGEWLRGIAQGVLPPSFRLDTGLTLERVLSLLEMLTQSFAEINDAQDNIRRHWLGRAPRASVLRSDNGRVILAYLLNPKADWGDRLGELESAISDVIMHELSLFKATLEGARGLIESLSPAALAKAEGIDLEALEEGAAGGFLGRLLPRDSPEARLWRRFAETYEGLMDGDRYQRLFLGRNFARTYLAAMGQREGSEER